MQQSRIYNLVVLQEMPFCVHFYCVKVPHFYHKNKITLTSDLNHMINWVFLPEVYKLNLSIKWAFGLPWKFPNQQKTHFLTLCQIRPCCVHMTIYHLISLLHLTLSYPCPPRGPPDSFLVKCPPKEGIVHT